MATIVTRVGKGSELAWEEVDANFTNLNNDKVETSRTISAGTGLTGGGNLTANRTLALSLEALTSLDKADTAVQPARTISAGTGLTGGGDLSANRTLALSAGTIASLAKADTAVQPAGLPVLVANDSDVTAGRVLVTGPGPAQAFRRGNVLGVVSQSAGVPTGALLEKGNNANGTYAKYADGSVVMGGWTLVNTYVDAQTLEAVITFPVTLSSSPLKSISMMLQDRNANNVSEFSGAIPTLWQGRSHGVSSWTLRLYNSAVNWSPGAAHWITWTVFGRWF